MEDQKMTQQEFADFLGQSPATLSSIFNGRTRPTLNIVDAIKAKISNISIQWLLYGEGDMYISHPESDTSQNAPAGAQDLMIDFDAPVDQNVQKNTPQASYFHQGTRSVRPEAIREEVKIIEKVPRRVTEIRVYYDDQTYETFLPAKK